MECNICNKQLKTKWNMDIHKIKCEYLNSIKDEVIDLYLNHNFSSKDLRNKFGGQTKDIKNILGNNVRSSSEAQKIKAKKYVFKHTEQSKQKLRTARLKFMKDNPDKTAWRKANLSYPEKLFLNKLIELNWGEKYRIEREFSVFPYFVDFAFVNEMVAVEIDGSQHLLPDRVKSDKKKEELLISLGWHVVRVTENEVKTNLNNFMNELYLILNSKEKVNKVSFGVFKCVGKKYIRVKRNENGLSDKQIENSLKQRKVERPSLEQLIKEIKLSNYCDVGKKYNVTDNTIRKWFIYYDVIPPKKNKSFADWKINYKNFCLCGNKIKNDSIKCRKCYEDDVKKDKGINVEQLLEDAKIMSCAKLGQKHNVSRNTISRWIKSYNKLKI